MTENQKQIVERKIWDLLKGYEHIYTTVQPTLTYINETDKFCMKKELLEKLPMHLRNELLNFVIVC
jgi:hypothetical protein